MDRVLLYTWGHHIHLRTLGIQVHIILALTINIAMPPGTTVETDFLGRCRPCYFGQFWSKVIWMKHSSVFLLR